MGRCTGLDRQRNILLLFLPLNNPPAGGLGMGTLRGRPTLQSGFGSRLAAKTSAAADTRLRHACIPSLTARRIGLYGARPSSRPEED